MYFPRSLRFYVILRANERRCFYVTAYITSLIYTLETLSSIHYYSSLILYLTEYMLVGIRIYISQATVIDNLKVRQLILMRE